MKGFKFKVQGIPWEVCPLPMAKILELADTQLDNKTPDFAGLTCYQTQKVYIVTDHESSIEFKRSTLFHELVHVFLAPAANLEEELVCNLVGNSLVEFFQQWHQFPLWVKGAIKHDLISTK